MLRVLIVALLLANLAFFAWTQGWLDSITGSHANGDREPERLQRQYRPESVRILPVAAASEPTAGVALACFEAGPFGDAESGVAQAAAQAALPSGTWTTVKIDQPGAWIVYMGRFADHDAQQKKEDELKRRNVPYEEVGDPSALAPGLSLGHFDERPAAARALDQFTGLGIRTARVVELSPPSSRSLVRVDKADKALATKIAALRADAIAGKAFAPCKESSGT